MQIKSIIFLKLIFFSLLTHAMQNEQKFEQLYSLFSEQITQPVVLAKRIKLPTSVTNSINIYCKKIRQNQNEDKNRNFKETFEKINTTDFKIRHNRPLKNTTNNNNLELSKIKLKNKQKLLNQQAACISLLIQTEIELCELIKKNYLEKCKNECLKSNEQIIVLVVEIPDRKTPAKFIYCDVNEKFYYLRNYQKNS